MSECTVKDQLTSAMKEAMRNREKARLSTIRLALAELKRIEVDEKSLDDTRALAALDKMAKQRRDAITQFESAGRTDLAEQEQFELTVIQEFLPEPLSPEDIDQIVHDAIAQSGAEGMKDMGKVMGLVKPQVQGRADMALISQSVKKLLG
ncbi:GatB/YqeY domain-containing protein [Endozoicomonas gorgoniicola]|uniref:GatB/YqeY domain-containing protein n=1 Tax=Endozoicomonas gorgoniicola TaxID=1234144 RepID=A0ABT3N3D6_9GAMM|nr:GatB/YqeY domain-containing protein [Endozoicomonas gorgoniicola]MCW7556145.1 GatB/YqeY domain-containing protein [Endozoicomonas gorgoniicola]